MRTQSPQKKPSRTSAVARCVAIRNVRKLESFWWMSQPKIVGRITLCPRLEMGNSSLTPCSSPSTIACPYEITCRAPLAAGEPTTGNAARSMPGGFPDRE